jgi:hypothetical protein
VETGAEEEEEEEEEERTGTAAVAGRGNMGFAGQLWDFMRHGAGDSCTGP